MKKVKIERLNLNTGNKKFLRKCARLYCEIWRESPWNENFWEVNNVIKDIKKQMKRPSAMGLVAFTDEKVVGFTWGYEVSKENLRKISGIKSLDILFENSRVFYIDELGVSSPFRKKKIGDQLSNSLIVNTHSSYGIQYFTLRTDVKAIAARNLYAKLGFVDLYIRDAKYPQRTYWLLKLH